jgi:hypothetical protein
VRYEATHAMRRNDLEEDKVQSFEGRVGCVLAFVSF